MEPDELPELQKAFASVDTSDPLALRAWFLAYPELTTSEHAQIMQKASITVATWRRRSKSTYIYICESSAFLTQSKVSHIKPLDKLQITPPANWYNNDKYIQECISKNQSYRQLARALGCSRYKLTIMHQRACRSKPLPTWLGEV